MCNYNCTQVVSHFHNLCYNLGQNSWALRQVRGKLPWKCWEGFLTPAFLSPFQVSRLALLCESSSLVLRGRDLTGNILEAIGTGQDRTGDILEAIETLCREPRPIGID